MGYYEPRQGSGVVLVCHGPPLMFRVCSRGDSTHHCLVQGTLILGPLLLATGNCVEPGGITMPQGPPLVAQCASSNVEEAVLLSKGSNRAHDSGHGGIYTILPPYHSTQVRAWFILAALDLEGCLPRSESRGNWGCGCSAPSVPKPAAGCIAIDLQLFDADTAILLGQ